MLNLNRSLERKGGIDGGGRGRGVIGSSYRVYLQSPPGAELPEARIPRGALLGLEELGVCRTESEIDGQPAAPEGPNIAEMEEFNE